MAKSITRPHIIKEIADELDALRQNRSQKNESTPIYQLPPEVLEIVFTLAIEECNQDPDYEKLPPPIWFNFACVSQRWRNVALNTSRIWGVLLLGHPKWAAVSLERSKEADLTINLNWNPTTSDDSINLMKEIFENHVSRIRNVHLSVNGFKKLHLGLYSFLGNLEDNSLSLHSFRLIVQNTVYIRFPVRIFSDTSRMRYLHIYNCFAKWPLSFPNLTHLRIHYSSTWDSSLDDFLTTLRGMPELQVLDLDNSFPRFLTRPLADTIDSPVPVAFPKLRSLDLHSRVSVDELEYFLPFLNIPSTTTIRLSSDGFSHFHDFRIRSMSAFLSRDFAAVSFESLRVYCPGRGFIVEIWKSETGISSTQILRLIWKIPMTIEPPWPSYDLITLILHIHISTEDLIQLFGRLPLLRSIVVSGQTVFNVISALSHKPQNYDILRSASYSVTFPALRSLSIRTLDSMPDKEVDLMLNCFMERRQRNVSLEELEILQCKCIHESHVNLLRQVVVNVRWDEDGMEDRPLSRTGHDRQKFKTLVRRVTKQSKN